MTIFWEKCRLSFRNKEDINILLEKAKKEALISLENHTDTAFAKVKNGLYDLDIFIKKNANKITKVENIPVYSGNGFDQK